MRLNGLPFLTVRWTNKGTFLLCEVSSLFNMQITIQENFDTDFTPQELTVSFL